jgi:Flp pilus assembly pilin Flp
MLNLYSRVLNCLNSEEGQDLAEYALLVGFIAIVVLAAIVLLTGALSNFFYEASRRIGVALGTTG